jgi:predicted Zn-dependent protease
MSRVLKQLFNEDKQPSQAHLKLVNEDTSASSYSYIQINQPQKRLTRVLKVAGVIGILAGVYFGIKYLSHRSAENVLKTDLKPVPVVSLHPDHQLNREAIQELELRNFKKALLILEKLANAHPELSSAQNNYGFALLRNNRIKEAKIRLKKAISLDPSNYIAHVNLGMAQLEERKYRDSIKSLKKAVSLNKDYPDTYLNLGKVYEKAGNFDEAVQSYEKFLGLNQSKKLLKGLIQNRIKKLKSLSDYQKKRKEEWNDDLPEKH